MFIDEAIIKGASGKGGDGASAFRREKSVQFGGPSGGDGGNGGDLYFVADTNVNTLIDFAYDKNFAAGDGGNGANKDMHGKDGEDMIVKVPVGTMVRDIITGKLLLDMSIPNEKRVLLKGGRGGNGNTHFKNSIRRAPRIAEKGVLGKELDVKLELKLLADVALVGYPNVGKSSFINKVSAAKSKVANYHFTTLNPKLGVVRVESSKSFVIADIPGLVEGAHTGKGLGDKFLKHIERCKMIYHIVDISGMEGRDPIEDYEKINEELKNYSEKLYSKPQIVIANKMDVLYDDENFNKLKNYLDKKGIELYPVSVILGEGLKDVIYKTYGILEKIDREPLEEEIEVEDIFDKLNAGKEDWVITKDEFGVYEVEGRIVDKVLRSYVLTGPDAIINFVYMLKERGLEDKLRNIGVKDGDVVRVAGIEFDFVE